MAQIYKTKLFTINFLASFFSDFHNFSNIQVSVNILIASTVVTYSQRVLYIKSLLNCLEASPNKVLVKLLNFFCNVSWRECRDSIKELLCRVLFVYCATVFPVVDIGTYRHFLFRGEGRNAYTGIDGWAAFYLGQAIAFHI